ncbi:hypothetical protein D9619_004284 [Psilocybe cf. subviscida]|uniref:Uncharacterized protein n=1 Tax=Psilocybe cf. subviscida TaxID=2480587 RepID=A0A8H5BQK9_9AGAR|nr:hypothetical protein D9619_004284 [Psilocybe cf. subviscida]
MENHENHLNPQKPRTPHVQLIVPLTISSNYRLSFYYRSPNMELIQRDVTTAFDDLDPGFQYEGNWQELSGSTRQWGGGVRSTQQTGATVSFTFFGMSFMLYQTIPSGTGTVVVDVSVDGGAPHSISASCGGDPVYGNVFFTSNPLAEINHTVVITNRANPSTPFQFDKVDILGNQPPTLLPPSQTVALFLSTPVMTVTQTPTSVATNVITTQNQTSLRGSRSSKTSSSSASHVWTPAATSATIIPDPSQTGLAPPVSHNITETDNPSARPTQSLATAAVSAPRRQVKPTLIMTVVPLRRSRVNKLNKDNAENKMDPQSPRGGATRPEPFMLDLLHPDHIIGGTSVNQDKRNGLVPIGAHTRTPDTPPEYRLVIN